MCGNGIRCLAAYIWKRRLSTKNPLAIETLAGVIKPKREKGGLVTVDMGRPIFEGSSIPTVEKGEIKDRPFKIADREFRITCVSMGNPHCVIFVKDAEGFPVEKYGPLIESHLFFPEKTNVEFVQVINRRRLRMRVWERGAGETPACGTGACAAAVVSRRMGFTAAGVSVILKGGVLYIEWRNDGRVYMKGPAKEVFTAEATI
jgi:diaminopimelate epimerase